MTAELSRRSLLALATAVPLLTLSRGASAQQQPRGASEHQPRGASEQQPRGASEQQSPLKIATIGSGNIGGFLGGQWVATGHEVFFSSRNPDQLRPMTEKLGAKARAGSPAEAVAFGDIVLLSVPYRAIPELGKEFADALRGKIMLDTCNATASRDGAELVELTRRNGIGKTTQSFFPDARIVRAFNTIGAGVLARTAHRDGFKMPIPIAGDDAAAVQVAERLVRDAGFDPVMAGGLARADAFAMGAPGYGVHADAGALRKVLDGVK